ncbi:MAG: hypothetical protein ONB44_01675 [candidate division KSB1 bacterium]|nr:hypothetical protein [candidate division KSB1 bacterium]MDZ7300830.1 hypothetical protein [candidate division KSB1 bacterium]MDZ7309899.1 hypothetical protein [candidate division KSB1 bacterium]
MKLDIPGLQPPVISEETCKLLLDFLSFRHRFRNIYGFELDFEKVTEIETQFPEAYKKFSADIKDFLRFLDSLAAAPSSKE